MSTAIRPSLRAIKRECRELADELVKEQYSLYDAIWTDRIRIDSALYDHGRDTVAELNLRMPNLLVHNPSTCSLDEIAAQYGFADTSELITFLLAYRPRGPVRERLYEQMLAEQLALPAVPQPPLVDAVPF